MAYEFDTLEAWGAGGGLFALPAVTLGADQTYITPRAEGSSPGYALDGMTPIVAASSDDAFGWLRDLGKTVVGYAIAKDAQQNKVQPPAVYAATAAQVQGQQVQRAQSNSLLLILLVGGLLVYAMKD